MQSLETSILEEQSALESLMKDKKATVPAYSWEHDKATSVGMLSGQADGTFLLRCRENEEFVMDLNYRSKTTHHLVAKQQDGVWHINQNVYGTPQTNLQAVR